MDLSALRLPQSSPFVVLAAAFGLLASFAFGGCAREATGKQPGPSETARRTYQVHFAVYRSQDHAALAAVTIPVHLGQSANVRTDSRVALESRAALPEFAATLTATNTPGRYQIVTKVAIREAARNKKGKLKISKRNQGALLPLRLGTTENASPDGDPVQIEVRVDAR